MYRNFCPYSKIYMRYQSNAFNTRKNRRLSKRTAPTGFGQAPRAKKPLAKYIGIIIGLAVVFFGLKLLLTPVMKTLANVWEESATAISFMLPGGAEIAKDSYGHTNILLVGIDRRSYQPYQYAGPNGELARNGFLADTIIIASVDSQGSVVNMVSLPRDLWVQVPAFEGFAQQHTKINAVHAFGDRFGYPDGGGMGLLANVTEQIVGVPIHYWARVDFDALVKGVDAIGGLDIYVEQAFTDYMYPRSGYEDAAWELRYQVVSFAEGWQYMDGETALQYARSRHALGPEGSDFARAKRQQNVINAFVTKVMSSDTLFSLDKIRGLYTAVSDNVATTVSIGDLPLFFQLARKADNISLQGHVLGGTDNEPPLIYAPDPGLFGGAYVLIPTAGQNNYADIQRWARDIFYQSAQLEPASP